MNVKPTQASAPSSSAKAVTVAHRTAPQVVASLRFGSTGAQVVELQRELETDGFDPGPTDGIFGPRTQAAVKAFQRAHHLVVDGIDGPATHRALAEAHTSTPHKPHVKKPSAVGDLQPNKAGQLSWDQVAQAAYQAGFRGKDLVDMVAISMRESSRRPKAFNGNSATGDRSYGLWQLNTLGSMGPYVKGILKKLGHTSFDALFDPKVNAQVAYQFYKDSGHKLTPWGGYKGMSNTFGVKPEWLRAAAAAVKRVTGG